MAANALNDSQKLDPIVDVVRLLFWKRSQLRPIPWFAQKTLSSQSGAPRAGLLGTKMIFIKKGCEEPVCRFALAALVKGGVDAQLAYAGPLWIMQRSQLRPMGRCYCVVP